MLRKPRTVTIHIDPKNYYEFDGITLDFNTQKLMGTKDNKHFPLLGNTRLEFSRKRDNKHPKLLHASSNPKGDAWFSPNHQLLAYDQLIAVDTNTNHIHGSTVSITAAYHLIPQKTEKDNVPCLAAVLFLIEHWNVTEKPENLGWYQVLQAIQTYPDHFAGKIGLIVDSDLGNHQAFNRREMPIYGDFYLPENVTIIYGSDQGGAEHLSTKMIKYCHNLASDLYKQQNLVMNTNGLHPVVDNTFSHFRQWDTINMDLRPFCETKTNL